jgi:hypothetical protein
VKTVAFTHIFDYLHDSQGVPSIGLTIRISGQPYHQSISALDVDAYLDTLSTRSVFDGQFATALGLHPFGGTISVRSGSHIVQARLYQLWITLPQFGSHLINAAFSITPLTRNFLGRDFLRLVTLAIEERNLSILIVR